MKIQIISTERKEVDVQTPSAYREGDKYFIVYEEAGNAKCDLLYKSKFGTIFSRNHFISEVPWHNPCGLREYIRELEVFEDSLHGYILDAMQSLADQDEQ